MVGSALKLCDLVLSNAWQSCIKSNDDKDADLDNADDNSSSGEPGISNGWILSLLDNAPS